MNDNGYIEAAAREIAASARIGRKGWKSRALAEARAEAGARLRAWREAEALEIAREAGRAEEVRDLPYREITERDAAEGCIIGTTHDGRTTVWLVDVLDPEPPGVFGAWGVLR